MDDEAYDSPLAKASGEVGDARAKTSGDEGRDRAQSEGDEGYCDVTEVEVARTQRDADDHGEDGHQSDGDGEGRDLCSTCGRFHFSSSKGAFLARNLTHEKCSCKVDPQPCGEHDEHRDGEGGHKLDQEGQGTRPKTLVVAPPSPAIATQIYCAGALWDGAHGAYQGAYERGEDRMEGPSPRPLLVRVWQSEALALADLGEGGAHVRDEAQGERQRQAGLVRNPHRPEAAHELVALRRLHDDGA